MTKGRQRRTYIKVNDLIVFKNSKNLVRVIYSLIVFKGTFYDWGREGGEIYLRESEYVKTYESSRGKLAWSVVIVFLGFQS